MDLLELFRFTVIFQKALTSKLKSWEVLGGPGASQEVIEVAGMRRNSSSLGHALHGIIRIRVEIQWRVIGRVLGIIRNS